MASDSFELLYHVFYLKTFHESRDALQITVTSSCESYILQNAVLYFEVNYTGTCAIGVITVLCYNCISCQSNFKIILLSAKLAKI